MAITRSTAILELSPAAYDEVEQKLLSAGYGHVFEQGPGSLIDMEGIAVQREPAPVALREIVSYEVGEGEKVVESDLADVPVFDGKQWKMRKPRHVGT